MAPVAAATVVAGVAAPDEEALSTANGRDVTPEGIPVSVPEPMAAAVVVSLLAAATAAILDATGLLVDADGVLVVSEELGLVLESEPLDPPAAEPLLELVSCPPDVGNTAAAPEVAAVYPEVDVAPEAAGAAGAAVVPSRGTDAAAPVEPALM